MERIWRLRPAATPLRAAGYGFGTLALLVGIDVLMGMQVAIVGIYLAAPFVPAFSGAPRATALVASTAAAAAILSGTWNDGIATAEHWTKVGLVAVGGGFAYLAAIATREGRNAFRRLEILDEVAALTAREADGASTLEVITSVLVPELGDFCMIDVADRNGSVNRAAVRACGNRRNEIETILAEQQPSLSEGWLGAAEDDPPESRVGGSERIGDLAVSSVVTVPLVARGRCTGAVTICRTEDSLRYDPAAVRFTTLLADRIAVALDSAGLFSDLQSAEERMEAAMTVLDEAVMIHDRAGAAVFANAATARMFDLADADDLEELDLGRLGERFDLFEEDGSPFDAATFTAARLLRGEEAGAQTLRAVSRSDGTELWARAHSGFVPDEDGRPHFVVTALADITDLKKAGVAQALLARLGELLESSLDYQRSVERLSELVVPDLADWCCVFAARDDGTIEEVATAHEDADRVAKAERLLSEYPPSAADPAGPARVLREGRPLAFDSVVGVLPRIARDERHLALLTELGLGAVLVLPMRSAGRILGALVLGNDEGRRPFDAEDRALAERVAGRAAVAFDNARLAAERAEIAETLQRGLLPAPLPDIPGWAVAALYRPAGGENQVGGDFYDAFEIEGGWMIVIGDVTGRGARAASITGQARHTVRAAATLTGDPLATLATLNRALLHRTNPALCSLAAIALESGSRTARVAVAGHPPPLLIGSAGVREAAGTGPVLGAFEDAGWELSSVEIDLSDQIVVFTDGVTEAEGAEGRFGEDRLRAHLTGVGEPGASIAAVDEALGTFCGGEPGDDAAMLAISPVVEAETWKTLNGSGSSGSTVP